MKQEGLYQNKVNSSLASIHNCKMASITQNIYPVLQSSKQRSEISGLEKG